MISIRPHKLFNLVKTKNYTDRVVKLVLPDQYTPMTFDLMIKLALARLLKPRTFFEIGTFLGVHTFDMAMNIPDCHFYTLDLDHASYRSAQVVEVARHLTEIQLQERHRVAFLGTPYEDRVTCLHGDSTTFDFSPYHGKMDMIFIDGGKEESTFHSDAETALRMKSTDHPAVVVWDDYGNRLSPGVKTYLDARPEELFFVEESITVFHLSNAPELSSSLRSNCL
jgi:hypothetical protein